MFIGSYSSKSPSFVSHSTRAKQLASLSSTATLSFATYSADYPDNAFAGVIPTKGTRCLLIPYTSGSLVEFDAADGSITEIAPIGNSAAYWGGCRTDNDLIILVPVLSAHIGIYSIKTGIFSTIDKPEDASFSGACQGKDGMVYFAPKNLSKAGVLDPNTLEFSYTEDLGQNNSDNFRCCQAMPDGRILFVPSSTDRAVIYDPSTQTYETSRDIGTGSSNYRASTPIPTGDIVLVPYSNNEICVYRAEGGEFYTTALGEAFEASFWGGAMLPDGSVLMAPYNEEAVGRYFPASDTYQSYESLANLTETSKYSGAATLESGQVVFCPYNAGNIVVATLGGTYEATYAASRFWASA